MIQSTFLSGSNGITVKKAFYKLISLRKHVGFETLHGNKLIFLYGKIIVIKFLVGNTAML